MKKNQEKMLEHSKAKVDLLKSYLEIYLSIIIRVPYCRRIRVYDLFCGEGIYSDGSEGSPIAIIRAINAVLGKATSTPISINCYFNDTNQDKIRNAKQIIEGISLDRNRITVIFTNEDYRSKITNVNNELTNMINEKAFIFIDPYGYKDIRANDIRMLLSNNNSEILMFLPIQFMYRFKDHGTPKALNSFLQDLDISQGSHTIEQFIANIKENFQKYLGGNTFIDKFPIRKNENTTYCLFFFSRHILGFEKMIEAKWKIDQESGTGWNYHMPSQHSLFDAQTENHLESLLINYLKPQRNNVEIYEFTLREGFLPKHTNQVLKELQKNNKINAINMKNPNERIKTGVFYISYEYYKNKNIKVGIQTK